MNRSTSAFPDTSDARVHSSPDQLEQLKRMTVVVVDTGDFASLKQYAPQDATTNPTLILKAAQMPDYGHLVDKAIAANKSANLTGSRLVNRILAHLLVLFRREILEIVPGWLSTESGASLSFDTAGIVEMS